MILLVPALFAIQQAYALNNGMARTPPMGWNPYNAFSCSTTEAQYKAAAQNLIDLGLRTLGYNFVNLDCGWQGKARNSSGGFTWDVTQIPNGVPALASFVHSLGMKFGVYSDAGFFACDAVGGTARYLGSLGHEADDARTYASWGADYLKYDNCYAVSQSDFVNPDPPIQLEPHFTAMRDALATTGRPIVFSVCEWGVQDPARWPGTAVGNSWRISNDVGPSWDNLLRIMNQLVPITGFAGPGGWNDLDLLEVGNSGLTLAEQQTQFAFWAAAKSPLFISTDLSRASSDTLNILKNNRIIGLNQDSLGKSIAFKRRYTTDHDVWAGPLSDGSTVAIIINFQNSARSVTFNLTDVGFSAATVVELISGRSFGRVTNSLTTSIQAHGSLVFKLTNTTPAPVLAFTKYPASSGTLTGGASIRSVNSTVSAVGFVGMGGTLTLHNVDGGSSGGTKLLSIDYINAEVSFSNSACSNCRNAFISVNNGSPVQVQMPISGQSWDILFAGYLVSLSGFTPGKTNTLQISNPNAWTPDFVSINVAV